MTIVINPLGQARKQELGRVEEYAYFLFLGSAAPAPAIDDLLNELVTSETQGPGTRPRWERLLRGGAEASRTVSPNLFYPVFINPETKEIASVGDPLPLDVSRHDVSVPDAQVAVWPLRTTGDEGRWRLAATTLRDYVERGIAKVGAYDRVNDRWTISYLGRAMLQRIEDGDLRVTGRDPVTGALELEYASATTTVAKTVWKRTRHRAGEYGSRVLTTFLGERRFSYPKSIYAVLDTLAITVGAKKDALILDFFAGSGTTFHSTCLLNAADDGHRRCILVTSNEVTPELTRKLNADGLFRGDAQFEEHGIFEAVTRPRCEAAITGRRPSGEPVEGSYLDGSPYADGFEENVEFLRLDYLDPNEVELGRQFKAILPILWLTAGGVGKRPAAIGMRKGWVMPADSTFAVLLNESRFRAFNKALDTRPDVTHVWLVTDNERAFAEMRASIPGEKQISMLYSDYLRNFRINARGKP